MSKPPKLVVAFIATCAGLVGCHSPESSPPNAIKLFRDLVASTIEQKGSFLPSGAAADSMCRIALLGGSWGTIALVNADGLVDDHIAKLPGFRQRGHFETRGKNSIAWSADPAYVGNGAIGEVASDSFIVPKHP